MKAKLITATVAVIAGLALTAGTIRKETKIDVAQLTPAQMAGCLTSIGITNVDVARCVTIHVNCERRTAIVTVSGSQ